METGVVVQWRVTVGDRIAEGDVLASVDTEKTEVDLEAPHSGLVAEILVAEGIEVPVGTPLLVLVEDRRQLGEYTTTQEQTD